MLSAHPLRRRVAINNNGRINHRMRVDDAMAGAIPRVKRGSTKSRSALSPLQKCIKSRILIGAIERSETRTSTILVAFVHVQLRIQRLARRKKMFHAREREFDRVTGIGNGRSSLKRIYRNHRRHRFNYKFHQSRESIISFGRKRCDVEKIIVSAATEYLINRGYISEGNKNFQCR